jgi:hypothetical protein
MKNLYRIIFFILVFFSQVQIAFAITAIAPSPTIVRVGIHLLGIDQLDLYKGSYAMDYHIIFKCDKVCPTFTLEVMNGSMSSISKEKMEPHLQIFRIKTLLQGNFDVKDYPFDSYWLKLELKDQLLDKSKVIFIVDPHFIIIDPQVILHGWEYRLKYHAMTQDYKQPLLGNYFTLYTFAIQIKRPILMGFLKAIFPSVIMILFAFISFFIPVKKVLNRFSIVSGALLGSVLFHLNLTSSLPPLGYLTYADSFMLINYFILFIILIENVYTTRLIEFDRMNSAIKIDYFCIYIIPLVWLLFQIFSAYLFFGIAK